MTEAGAAMDTSEGIAFGNYSVEDLLKRAEELVEGMEHEAAFHFYGRALQMEPNNVRVLDELAQCLLDCGQAEAAMGHLTKSIELAPTTGHEKFMNMGQLLQGGEALACYRRGIEILQQEIAAMEGVAGAEGARKAAMARMAAAYASAAELFMTDLCYEEDAEEQCTSMIGEALRCGPEDVQAHLVHAQLLLVQQKAEEGKAAAVRSHDLWKDVEDEEQWPAFEVRKTQAKLLLEIGEVERSQKILEALTLSNSDDSEVWYVLGICYTQAGLDWADDALECYRAAEMLLLKMPADERPEGALEEVRQALADVGAAPGAAPQPDVTME